LQPINTPEQHFCTPDWFRVHGRYRRRICCHPSSVALTGLRGGSSTEIGLQSCARDNASSQRQKADTEEVRGQSMSDIQKKERSLIETEFRTIIEDA
jgi:hypothetical protein